MSWLRTFGLFILIVVAFTLMGWVKPGGTPIEGMFVGLLFAPFGVAWRAWASRHDL